MRIRTELVVKFARDLAQRHFACRDQLTGQFVTPFGQGAEFREQPPVRADHIQPGDQAGGERRTDEEVSLALHLVVNVLHPARRLLFAFVVGDEHPRHRGAQCRLARLQRHANLRARVLFGAVAGGGEHPVHRGPELRERTGQVALLLGCPPRDGDLFLATQGIVQIGANPVELPAPGGQRIVGGVDHVAHRQGGGVEVVLDAQQLQ